MTSQMGATGERETAIDEALQHTHPSRTLPKSRKRAVQRKNYHD